MHVLCACLSCLLKLLHTSCRLSGCPVLLKIFTPEQLDCAGQEKFLHELRIQNQLEHPNVLATYATFQDSGRVVQVLEHAGGDTLLSLLRMLGHISEKAVANLVLEPLLQVRPFFSSGNQDP